MKYPKAIYVRVSTGSTYRWFGASNENTSCVTQYQFVNRNETELPKAINNISQQTSFNNTLACPLTTRADMYILQQGCCFCSPPRVKRIDKAPFDADNIKHGVTLDWDGRIDPPTP